MGSPEVPARTEATVSNGIAYVSLDAPAAEHWAAALRDVREGLRQHHAWRFLAVEHVKNQYRRTLLGPWWLTLQTGAYVLGLSLVFGGLLHTSLQHFLPYIATGYVGFSLLSGLTRSGSLTFVSAAETIKSTRQPLASIVLRNVAIEMILFAHNLLIIAGFYVFGLIKLDGWVALLPLDIVVVVINGVAVALWLGTVVARFRDLGPAVESILQVLVFFTPVFYRASNLGGSRALLLAWNPFTYFVDLLRDAMTGQQPTSTTLVGVLGFTLVNVFVAIVISARTRSRLPYWVA